MHKKILCSFAIMTLFIAPMQSHAAGTDIQTLTSQYKALMMQFESLKMRNSSSSSSTRPFKVSSTTINKTCMATAVATREASIMTAWGTYSTSIVSSLTKRADALSDAWNASSSKDLVKSAWSTWKSDKKAADTALKNSRKTAWDTFTTTAKNTCKTTLPTEEKLTPATSDSIAL
jgi:hypothetical protein